MKKLVLGLALLMPLAACTATEKGAVIGGASGVAIGAAVAGIRRKVHLSAARSALLPAPLSAGRLSVAATANIATAAAASIPTAARMVIDRSNRMK